MNVDKVDDECHDATAKKYDDDDARLFGQGWIGCMVLT